uniref:Uncharacterized protein n=1 Tax=Schlesneria paludicola TaxID=360056 RepID=A0A7C2JZF2_9PLAN
MPLPMKSLKEAAAELGIPEAELRVMVQTNKVRAVMRKGTLCIAPDALAKISRQRRTILDPTNRSAVPKPATPAKPAATGAGAKPPPRTAAPPRSTTGSADATPQSPAPKRPALKLPEPPKDA